MLGKDSLPKLYLVASIQFKFTNMHIRIDSRTNYLLRLYLVIYTRVRSPQNWKKDRNDSEDNAVKLTEVNITQRSSGERLEDPSALVRGMFGVHLR